MDLYLRLDWEQAELVATVDFAARELAAMATTRPDELAVLFEVMKWKQRRRPPLEARDIGATIRNLNVLGWLDVEATPDLPGVDEEEEVDVVTAS